MNYDGWTYKLRLGVKCKPDEPYGVVVGTTRWWSVGGKTNDEHRSFVVVFPDQWKDNFVDHEVATLPPGVRVAMDVRRNMVVIP